MTSTQHPVDSAGVPLPDGSWPDLPGSGGSLDVVRRFCNSINREQGGEAWRDTDELDRWLQTEGYEVGRLGPQHLHDLLLLRDALWRSILGRSPVPLGVALGHLRFRPIVDGAVLRLAVSGTAADMIAGRLAGIIVEAQSTGAWDRIKACQHCGWVFIDASRNNSGRWCSMSACGARAKARAYRRRRRLQDASGN